MPAQIRSVFSPILLAVQAQLAAVTGLPPTRVLLVARNSKVPKFQGDSDIVVRPGRFLVPDEGQEGAGRTETIIRRVLRVRPRTRRLADSGDREDVYLTDSSLGYFLLEESCLSALQMFEPVDGTGNVLTYEPIRLHGGAEVERADQSKAPGWGSGALDFEVAYIINIDQNLNLP